MNEERRLRLDWAVHIAREAGELTLEYFRTDRLETEIKEDLSPVTVADRNAEQLLRKRILEKFPDDGVLGEEFPETPGTSGYRWILDPIDGTKSFVRGTPQYGTMIGIELNGESVVGVVGIPVLDEYYYGGIGLGSFEIRHGGLPQRLKVSQCKSLKDGMFLTTSVKHFENWGRFEAYEKLRKAAGLDRTWGDCYGYMLVASGRAEVMVDPKMSVWDCAALPPILLEAGGTFTDWNGKPTIHSGDGIATNGHVLEEVLAITKQHPRVPAQS